MKYFTVSFDDGIEQDKRLIALMKKYGIKGTFNINGGLLGKKGTVRRIGDFAFKDCGMDVESGRIIKYTNQFRIPEDEIAQVYEGMEVASHGYLHQMLGRLSQDEMKKEIEYNLQKLEQLVGYPIVGHAYAKGSTSVKVQNYLKEKEVLYARGALANSKFDRYANPLNLAPTCYHITKENKINQLIDQFIEIPAEEEAIFFLWGHAYELDYQSKEASWEKIERIFDRIAGRSDIFYCTNKEIFTSYK